MAADLTAAGSEPIPRFPMAITIGGILGLIAIAGFGTLVGLGFSAQLSRENLLAAIRQWGLLVLLIPAMLYSCVHIMRGKSIDPRLDGISVLVMTAMIIGNMPVTPPESLFLLPPAFLLGALVAMQFGRQDYLAWRKAKSLPLPKPASAFLTFAVVFWSLLVIGWLAAMTVYFVTQGWR